MGGINKTDMMISSLNCTRKKIQIELEIFSAYTGTFPFKLSCFVLDPTKGGSAISQLSYDGYSSVA